MLGLFHLFWLILKPCSAKSCSDLTHSFSFIRSTVRSLFPSSELLSRNSFSKNKVKLRELIAKTQNDYVQPVSLLIFLKVTNHLCVTPAFSKSVWAPSISILILLCSLAKANLFCYPLPITFTLFFFCCCCNSWTASDYNTVEFDLCAVKSHAVTVIIRSWRERGTTEEQSTETFRTYSVLAC